MKKKAESIIKEQGLESCTIRTLAKEANVAVGTLYNYFPSHKDLLEAVFEQSWGKTIINLRDIVFSKNTTDEKIITFFKIIDQDIKDRNGIGRALFDQPFNINEIESTRYKSFIKIRDFMISLLKESSNNNTLSDEILVMNATWILLGHIGLKHTYDNFSNGFSKEVLKRFF